MGDQQETLLTTVVPRSLEAKNKILGFELLDVILILLNLSLQNLVFGATALKFPMVIGTSALFAGTLFFFKRGKPDQFLTHYAEYLKLPTQLAANSTDTNYRPFEKGRMNG